jgi:hypothetical protein
MNGTCRREIFAPARAPPGIVPVGVVHTLNLCGKASQLSALAQTQHIECYIIQRWDIPFHTRLNAYHLSHVTARFRSLRDDFVELRTR